MPSIKQPDATSLTPGTEKSRSDCQLPTVPLITTHRRPLSPWHRQGRRRKSTVPRPTSGTVVDEPVSSPTMNQTRRRLWHRQGRPRQSTADCPTSHAVDKSNLSEMHIHLAQVLTSCLHAVATPSSRPSPRILSQPQHPVPVPSSRSTTTTHSRLRQQPWRTNPSSSTFDKVGLSHPCRGYDHRGLRTRN